MGSGKKLGIVIGAILGITAIIGGIVAAVKIIDDKQQGSGGTGTNIENSTSNSNSTPKPTQEEIEKSKELEEEIKKDVADKKPEEFDTIIDYKQNELNQAKQELEDLKNAGASEEEIAKAEEKQQTAEKQLESVKEEKSYWTATSGIKELYQKKYGQDGSYIRNINDIYRNGSWLGVECDVVYKDGNGLIKQTICVFNMFGKSHGNIYSLSELKQCVDDATDFKKAFEMTEKEISEEKQPIIQTFLDSYLFTNESETYTIKHQSMELTENGELASYSVIYEKKEKSGHVSYYSDTFNFEGVYETMSEQEMLEEFKKKNYQLDIDSKRGMGYISQLDIDWKNSSLEYKGQMAEEE